MGRRPISRAAVASAAAVLIVVSLSTVVATAGQASAPYLCTSMQSLVCNSGVCVASGTADLVARTPAGSGGVHTALFTASPTFSSWINTTLPTVYQPNVQASVVSNATSAAYRYYRRLRADPSRVPELARQPRRPVGAPSDLTFVSHLGGTAFARSSDSGVTWQTLTANADCNYVANVGAVYYCTVESSNGGTSTLFSSLDAESWEPVGPLSANLRNVGGMSDVGAHLAVWRTAMADENYVALIDPDTASTLVEITDPRLSGVRGVYAGPTADVIIIDATFFVYAYDLTKGQFQKLLSMDRIAFNARTASVAYDPVSKVTLLSVSTTFGDLGYHAVLRSVDFGNWSFVTPDIEYPSAWRKALQGRGGGAAAVALTATNGPSPVPLVAGDPFLLGFEDDTFFAYASSAPVATAKWTALFAAGDGQTWNALLQPSDACGTIPKPPTPAPSSGSGSSSGGGSSGSGYSSGASGSSSTFYPGTGLIVDAYGSSGSSTGGGVPGRQRGGGGGRRTAH